MKAKYKVVDWLNERDNGTCRTHMLSWHHNGNRYDLRFREDANTVDFLKNHIDIPMLIRKELAIRFRNWRRGHGISRA